MKVTLDSLRIEEEQERQRNKERESVRRSTIYAENKARAVEQMGGKCMRCNGVFPIIVYDFHHRDPSDKHKQITQYLNRLWGQLLEIELSKCDLLCANCHRILHGS